MTSSTPNILIVDDSAAIRRRLIKLLEPLNASFEEVENGQQAWDRVTTTRVDIILTDIDMPKMDGIEFCRKLKKTPQTRGIPVVVVSSLDSDEDIEKGFEVGATYYIAKNDVYTDLFNVVQEILSRTKRNSNQLIMVVDDSPTIRQIVKNGLETAGFRVITAENGKQALELLQVRTPDLILSDIDMPEMNGFEFCETVYADPELSGIPFVVMSAKNDRGHMNRMLQHGAASYVCKPFNLDALVIQIEEILSNHFLLLLKERERLETERNMVIASISSLISALEARDPYTKGHSEVVGTIVSGMLALTGASKQEVNLAHIGGRLHDIGKIGVRDSVLLKSGPLTDIELSHIMEHPIKGAEIIKNIPSLSDIVSIVRHHHERMDGHGYPEGLKGNQIPLLARMTAVADTYHALNSDRPYRTATSHDRSLQIINDARDTQLCPDCVDLFFKWCDKNHPEKKIIRPFENVHTGRNMTIAAAPSMSAK
ncbi:MAG: response regulator [Thermodesulfobacteriota bacterium]|nr:response regulator [Thermodesulfobacteriota bacterium]